MFPNFNLNKSLRKGSMAHSLRSTPPAAAPAVVSPESRRKAHLQTLGFQRVWASQHQTSAQPPKEDQLLNRRKVISLGLVGAVVAGLSSGEQRASAARRPPPPPAREKQDPNLSGVQAKVLASKKRKEAMKETMAKLREQGKTVTQQPSE